MKPYVERLATFTVKDGEFDIQLWAEGYRPLTGKVYRIKVPVPAELVGETVEVEIKPEPVRGAASTS